MTEAQGPLISVIVPAYNYAHLLPRALESVLAQRAPWMELIVVDDGSTDETARLLADYATRHRELLAISQANAGAAAARNRGVRLARGRYALLLDADDELLPDALQSLRATVARHPEAGTVLGAQVSVYPDGRERLRAPTRVPVASPLQLSKRYLLQKRIAISHGSSLFRRDLLLQRPYPESLRGGEDVPVFVHMLVSAPVVTTSAALARIHKHRDSLRHDRQNEEQRALSMIDEVFASLPVECQPLRDRYASQRYLSLFRAALQAGDRAAARRFYQAAWRLNRLQTLRWSYLRKAVRLSLR
ncbi:MAG TPA: glycosyltransferase family A protein [Candidatus Accumulibacter phosphatis]|nr:MAG: Chondroitin polymerase [Candidatus Accumulibacter sp. SK-11]HCV12929.1 glycosyltransferase family 2 protein [Accumulibacter sp.]HRL76623.1 glycosyltransferase family A protein [Candidatus Accumulibacter phosphatis]HRQ96509.1 glycosyltransferase family A protein [Candidatus Accumulibacter phosphatis]